METSKQFNEGGKNAVQMPVVTTVGKMAYRPPNVTTHFIGQGSTGFIWKHPTHPGLVVKYPFRVPLEPRTAKKYEAEIAVLEALGKHPRIIKYLGTADTFGPEMGLIFEEAVNDDVQKYLNVNSGTVEEQLRIKWCKQAAEGIAYCHLWGVLHRDVRPDNMLLDANLDLSLCDFGGSQLEKDHGLAWPDSFFCDPRDDPQKAIEATDILSLGTCMYIFMTGHYPHGPMPSNYRPYIEHMEYAQNFEKFIREGQFPDVNLIRGGDVIMDCWTKRISSASEAYDRYVQLEDQQRLQSSSSTA